MPKEKVTLASLSDAIATEVGVDRDTVFRVMNSVCKHIGLALDRRAHVVMMDLGSMHVKEDEYGFPKIVFAPTPKMTKHVRVRDAVNKYGVVLDRNKSITAKLTGKCPNCGTDLESRDPPKCPRCGTEPFEERPESQDEEDTKEET